MLSDGVVDFKGCWDDHLCLIEYSYNNSYHSSISMAPFQPLYCRWCRSLIRWFEVDETSLLGPEILYEAIEKVRIIRDRLNKVYSRQKSYAYNRRRDLDFELGDHVYLNIRCDEVW